MQKNIIWRTFHRLLHTLHGRMTRKSPCEPYTTWVQHSYEERASMAHEIHTQRAEITYLLQTVRYYADHLERVLDDYYQDSQKLRELETWQNHLMTLSRDYEYLIAQAKVRFSV